MQIEREDEVIQIDEKLPLVRELCLQYVGLDPVKKAIPVRPVVHYCMGGVHTATDATTELAGLYAAGECACVSMNGANRLGSNSLVEILVFGARAGKHAALFSKEQPAPNEELAHAQAREARIYAELLGDGTSADAYHISAPDENGAGAVKAISAALEDARLSPPDVGYINAHGTSTRLNDKSETAAIKKVFGDLAYNIPISSTKSCHGHLLGAGGALEALISVKALNAGMIPPTINYSNQDPECDLDYVPNHYREEVFDVLLSNSFGFGGHNAALVIGKYGANGLR